MPCLLEEENCFINLEFYSTIDGTTKAKKHIFKLDTVFVVFGLLTDFSHQIFKIIFKFYNVFNLMLLNVPLAPLYVQCNFSKIANDRN